MADSKAYEINYELPDGQTMVIGKERFKCTELMFKPKLAGFDYSGIH